MKIILMNISFMNKDELNYNFERYAEAKKKKLKMT